MLSARAGEEGTVEGLEAGADDYLVKPFSARELLARVRANLELDRAAASGARSSAAGPCSTRRSGSPSSAAGRSTSRPDALRRLRGVPPDLGRSREEFERARLQRAWSRAGCTPTTATMVRSALTEAAAGEAPGRVRGADRPAARRAARGQRARGEVVETDATGGPGCCAARSRTSPSSAAAEQALAAAAAAAEAAAREHAIADELQRSLLPAAVLRPRAPRRRDLLPGRRRGHPGRRRLVRRHRARRRPDRPRGRRRDGPRRAARPPVMGQLRSAVRAFAQPRPAAGRGAGVPRRHRAGPRRRPDRHLPLRGLRPRRPDPAATPTPGTCRRSSSAPPARRRCSSTAPARRSAPGSSGCARRGRARARAARSRSTPTAWWSGAARTRRWHRSFAARHPVRVSPRT